MARDRKKYTAGDAVAYLSRNKALRKLQLSLADFRRLCILKGIYPAEPGNRKKVNKGSSAIKTYFHAKDIRYLSHEPIIKKFRELKVFSRKLKTARAKRDLIKANIIQNNKPILKLDHIVRERGKHPTSPTIQLCRRLSLEFLHYVMLTRSLRKCFISIKGYYFQADIVGQKVTWILPHSLGFKQPTSVDFKIMESFLEFYVHMLGFVNFKLYTDINRYYPPKLTFSANEKTREMAADTEFFEEMLASLNVSPEISHSLMSEHDDYEEVDLPVIDESQPSILSHESIKELKCLFEQCKFFLSREIPREIFTFVIRCFGGEVSWPADAALGSTYQEEDECITHHVIDRPRIEFMRHGRIYIQPQWVFDCVNAGHIIPPDRYLPGANLPPHLSPFVVEKPGDYVPPERSTSNQLPEHEAIHEKPSDTNENKERAQGQMTVEERKLKEMMLPKKHRRIYNKAVFSQKRKRREIEKLKEKRQRYEENHTLETKN